MEIERKFLIDGFPDMTPSETAVMEQGYICADPTVRIRSKEKDGHIGYMLCFKGEGSIAREEIELPLDKETFDRLAALLKGPMIRKEYRVYDLPGGYKLECSLVDEGRPTSFYYAEVEFPTLEEAHAFQPPTFLGRDVTEERGYGMSSYWTRTRLGTNT